MYMILFDQYGHLFLFHLFIVFIFLGDLSVVCCLLRLFIHYISVGAHYIPTCKVTHSDHE